MSNITPLSKINSKYIIVFLLILGAFFRFYNLNWGSPYYFHPDERNIVDLVLKSSLSNPQSLLKGTFAYGNFPVILALLVKPFLVPFFQLHNITDPFAQTVIIIRSISAFFSVATLIVIYISGKMFSPKIATVALIFSTFSEGFIQQAHFGTFDGIVVFCAVAVFYFLLKFIKTDKILFTYYSTLFIAIGCAAKINLGLILLFPLGLIIRQRYMHSKKYLYIFKHTVGTLFLFFALTPILSPAYLTPEFYNSLFYERSLVTGAIPVFYTQSFFGTTPVLFQFLHIYPFLINPFLTIFFMPAFFYVLVNGIKTKNKSILFLISYFLLLFLPQAFLFAKWTRYMVPTLPFIYLIIAIVIIDLLKFRKKIWGAKLFIGLFITVSAIFGISYFLTAFTKQDTRIAAANFARNNIPTQSKIMSEPYDLGLMPFNALTSNISIFNFYEFDNNSPEFNEQSLNTALQNSQYIILPSQRLIRSRLLNKNQFPKGHTFYINLLSGNLGYQKIYETPCDIFCRITYLKNPDLGFEETANVFERPTVFIFKKVTK